MRIGRILALILAVVLCVGFLTVPVSASGERMYGIGFVSADSLRLRAQPNSSSETLCYAPRDDCVVVIGEEGDWYKVNYNLQTGYMCKDYLSVRTKENAELGYGIVTGSGVSLRSGPSTSYQRTAVASQGETCYILGLNEGWYKVSYKDSVCYICSDCVELTEIPYENQASTHSPQYFRHGQPIGDSPLEGADTVQACADRILTACVRDGAQAEAEVKRLLTRMEELDSGKARLWEDILDNWAYTYRNMAVGSNVLPDGLPEDDSLCIVVFGYCLNPDGSARQELIDRLTVALRSAEKYPNAFILCTGGATATRSAATEAGVMAAWLRENGISASRILEETKAMTTLENALKSDCLMQSYPQIQHAAVVSSDYHVRRCGLFLGTTSLNRAAKNQGRRIDVVAGAACPAVNRSNESVAAQASGIAGITGIGWTL